MNSVSARILMTIVVAKNLDVMTGDKGNTYLKSNTDGNIYICAGAKFELVGMMDEGALLEVVKALYEWPTSGNRCHAHLTHTLRAMGFKTNRFDPDNAT